MVEPQPETILADTVEPMTFSQMAKAFRELGETVPHDDADLEIDLDDYPLY